MTNIPQTRNSGFVLIISLVVILLLSGIIVLILSGSILNESKNAQYEYQAEQAYNAADAGLEKALVILNVDNALFFNSSGASNLDSGGALNNGATYTYTIVENIINSGSSVYDISSVGRSSDGIAVKSMAVSAVEIRPNPYMLDMSLPAPVIAKGAVALSGNASVDNPEGSISVSAGGAVSLAGSADTSSTAGSSDRRSLGADLDANSASINALSNDEYFETYMGDTKTNVENSATLSYPITGSENYSSVLDGIESEIVWIDEASVSIQSNSVIGSADNPVILIFTGEVELRGGIEIHGVIYAMGNLSMGNGGAEIDGTILSEGNISFLGTLDSDYVNIGSVEVGADNGEIDGFYTVPGSWRDF